MLDRAALLTQLKQHSAALFVDLQDHVSAAVQLWQEMIAHPSFQISGENISSLRLPRWHASLRNLIAIPQMPYYHIQGIDGSQIYPDRHQGTLCFLINIGTTHCCYAEEKASFKGISKPYIYFPQQGIEYSVDWVNAHRQELEFKAALDQDCDTLEKKLILFDGSLIFWHLEHAPLIAQEFIAKYMPILTQFYNERYVTAGYISAPRNRELINLLTYFNDTYAQQPMAEESLKQLIDVDLMSTLLPREHRTQVFISGSPLQWAYSLPLQPSFFYCNTGYEIARIEIPWWIAKESTMVDDIAAIILNQCYKGRGYPVALSEAHEQAVIKSSDRDFFYHSIAKIGFESYKKVNISYKHLKKRLVSI